MKGHPAQLELEPIRLAREPDFMLGGLGVRPSVGEVEADGTTERLEPRVMQVLVALARARGAVVSRDDLIACCWGGTVVGDAAINRVIAQLRRLAEREGGRFRIETRPRIGFRLLTDPEQTKPNPSPPRLTSASASASTEKGAGLARPLLRSRRWALTASGAAALAGMGIAVFLARPSAVAKPKLVAVLPFDGGGGPDSVRLADAVSDSILSGLTRSGGLPVAARHSSFQFRGERKGGAAEALGASHLIDGTVSREGELLRVTAFLIDAERDLTLWSEQFEAPVSQVFSVQDQISTRVAEKLGVGVGSRAVVRAIDPVAHDLYTRATVLIEEPSQEAIAQARAYLAEAVTLAPDFALGWAGLAEAQRQNLFFIPPAQQGPERAASRRSAERALHLDPGLGQVYGTLAGLTPRFHRWREIDRLFARGLSLAPEHQGLRQQHAEFLQETSRTREAARRTFPLQQRNPLSAHIASAVAYHLFELGRDEEALVAVDRAYARWPSRYLWNQRVHLHFAAGSYATAEALLAAPLPHTPPELLRIRRLVLTARRDRRPEDVAAAVSGFEALSRTGTVPAMTAIQAICMLDQGPRALAIADALYRPTAPQAQGAGVTMTQSYSAGGEAETGLLFARLMAPLRRQPGFRAILERVGLVDYWRTAGVTPDFCSEPGLGRSCRAMLA